MTVCLIFTEPLTEEVSYPSRTVCSEFYYWHAPYYSWASELTCTTAWLAGVAPSPNTIIGKGLRIQTIHRQMALYQSRVQPYFGSYFPKPYSPKFMFEHSYTANFQNQNTQRHANCPIIYTTWWCSANRCVTSGILSQGISSQDLWLSTKQ